MPFWLQVLAWGLLPAYVFEGLSAAIIRHVFRLDLMLEAFAINLGRLVAGGGGFLALLASARKAGALLQVANEFGASRRPKADDAEQNGTLSFL